MIVLLRKFVIALIDQLERNGNAIGMNQLMSRHAEGNQADDAIVVELHYFIGNGEGIQVFIQLLSLMDYRIHNPRQLERFMMNLDGILFTIARNHIGKHLTVTHVKVSLEILDILLILIRGAHHLFDLGDKLPALSRSPIQKARAFRLLLNFDIQGATSSLNARFRLAGIISIEDHNLFTPFPIKKCQ